MKGDKYSYKIISERIDNKDGYTITHKFEGEVRDVSNNEALINYKTRLINKNDASEIVEMHEGILKHPKRNRIETIVKEVIE